MGRHIYESESVDEAIRFNQFIDSMNRTNLMKLILKNKIIGLYDIKFRSVYLYIEEKYMSDESVAYSEAFESGLRECLNDSIMFDIYLEYVRVSYDIKESHSAEIERIQEIRKQLPDDDNHVILFDQLVAEYTPIKERWLVPLVEVVIRAIHNGNFGELNMENFPYEHLKYARRNAVYNRCHQSVDKLEAKLIRQGLVNLPV